MTCGCNCGSIRKTPAAVTPVEPTVLSIMSGNIVAGWDAASLITSPVPTWQDEGSGSFALTATNPPIWNATGGPNNQPSVLYDGVNDASVNTTLNLPAPGTIPTFYWGVLRQVTWGGGRKLWGAGIAVNQLEIGQASGSPNIVQFNPGPANTHSGLTVNTYKRIESFFNAATTDYTKAGASAATTGVSAGNNDPDAGFTLGAAANLSTFGNIEVCEFWIFNVQPSAGQKASLDTYVTNRYGAGLV